MDIEKCVDSNSDQKCPFCSRMITSSEYNVALSKLEKQIEERYKKEEQKHEEQYEEKLKKITETHEKDKDKQDEFYKIQIENLQKTLESDKGKLEDKMKKQNDLMIKQYRKQSQDSEKRITKQYEDMIKSIKKQNKESEIKFNQTLKEQMKRKDVEIKELEQNKTRQKNLIYEKTKEDFQEKLDKKDSQIKEKELQISRANQKAEELQDRLSKTQSELKGEIGEHNLLEQLQNGFPNDKFVRQKRGQSTADIYQTIVLKDKKIDIQIAYDNKENTNVTIKDIEKAKKYAKDSNVKYVIIVSTSIPKSYAPNGIYGLKDGIIIVNPRIVIEVATRCRDNIIEISRIKKGTKDRDVKESRLFDYMISSEFSGLIRTVYETNEKMRQLQDREVRLHKKLWKDRSDLRGELVRAYMDIESNVESITQKETIVEEIMIENN